MTTAAPATPEPTTWSVSAPHVRKAIAFIKRRHGGVTADDLVSWDLAHGRRLFTWEDDEAAREWRLHEARLFMNRFRSMFDNMRVRAIIHINQDDEAGISRSAYQTVETIAAHPGMRAQVVADITNRMKMLASELAMWKLTQAEQEELFHRLHEAMTGATRASKVA